MDDADFEQFWSAYPRKVAKAHARKMWQRLNAEQKFAATHALPVHVRYWRISGRDVDKVPHAGTWLSGERWEDELEMPAAPEEQQWWRTRSGIEARARAKGIAPKPGEDHDSLRARIMAMERG